MITFISAHYSSQLRQYIYLLNIEGIKNFHLVNHITGTLTSLVHTILIDWNPSVMLNQIKLSVKSLQTQLHPIPRKRDGNRTKCAQRKIITVVSWCKYED